MNILKRDFDPEQYRCHSGSITPPEALANLLDLHIELIRTLDLLATVYGPDTSIHLDCGYRDPAYNDKLPGAAPHSQHELGKAGDFMVFVKGTQVPPHQIADFVDECITLGSLHFGGLGRYGTFTHADIRVGHARWIGARTSNVVQS